jgi:hypothetical protein
MNIFKKNQFILLLLFIIAGCSDNPADPGNIGINPGTAKVTVTGDLNAEKEGDATFNSSTVSFGDEPLYYIWEFSFDDAPFPHGVGASFYVSISGESIDSERPQVGTYQIVDKAEDNEMFYGYFSDISDGVQNIDNYATIGQDNAGGSLTIKESSSELIKGTFEFIAFNSFTDDAKRVTVQGEFSATVSQ